MRFKLLLLAISVLLLAGCLYEPVHQGNRLDENKVFQIKEGDTKFRVEQLLGTPMLRSTLHPNRVTYFEEFEDEESGNLTRRSVEITYDDALRVTGIRYEGIARTELTETESKPAP